MLLSNIPSCSNDKRKKKSSFVQSICSTLSQATRPTSKCSMPQFLHLEPVIILLTWKNNKLNYLSFILRSDHRKHNILYLLSANMVNQKILQNTGKAMPFLLVFFCLLSTHIHSLYLLKYHENGHGRRGVHVLETHKNKKNKKEIKFQKRQKWQRTDAAQQQKWLTQIKSGGPLPGSAWRGHLGRSLRPGEAQGCSDLSNVSSNRRPQGDVWGWTRGQTGNITQSGQYVLSSNIRRMLTGLLSRRAKALPRGHQ